MANTSSARSGPKRATQAQPQADRERPRVSGPTRSILRGELDKVGLVTLLTILEMERRSGVLLVQKGRELGRLYVRDGQVVRARIEGARRPAGVEAVYAVLAWPEGQFELWQAEVEGKDEIGQRTAFLLMEGMRRMDEARAPEGALAAVAAEPLIDMKAVLF